ncbi:hypothetical protein AB0I00_18945 [Streptomyces sp. NPDC050803]|uniref:hypothetical protein n=1 Tax=unclassified Streptomyces TaxID=2593676 RepID=UPI003438C387
MTGERLNAEWLRGWCEQTETALADLMRSFEERHGFPPDTNAIASATDESHEATAALVELTPIPSDLTTLYWAVDEISLPDVHIGYFVHSASTTASHVREYGLLQIEGEEPAVVFASDGGGHLFALAGSGRVWRSTTASWSGQFDLAAAGLQEFFEELSRQISRQL